MEQPFGFRTYTFERINNSTRNPRRDSTFRSWDNSPMMYTYVVTHNDDFHVDDYHMVSIQYSTVTPKVAYLYYPAVSESLIVGHIGFCFGDDKQEILDDIRTKNYQFLLDFRERLDSSVQDSFSLSIEPSSDAAVYCRWHQDKTGFPRIFILNEPVSLYQPIDDLRWRRLNPPVFRLHVWFAVYPRITYGIIITHFVKTDYPGEEYVHHHWRAYTVPLFLVEDDDRVVRKVIQYNYEYLKKLSNVIIGNKYFLGGVDV